MSKPNIVLTVLLATSVGCTGVIGSSEPAFEEEPRIADPNPRDDRRPAGRDGGTSNPAESDGGTGPQACVPGDLADGIAASPLIPLNSTQYRRSIDALLETAAPALDLDDTDEDRLSLFAVEKLNAAAEAIVATPAYRTQRPASCAPSSEHTCLDEFLDGFATRAFRRPLTSDERSWLHDTFTRARTTLDFTTSIDVVAKVILQSPQMVYLRVDGTPDPQLSADLLRLTGYEIAARLSFFLWGAPPDDALLQIAGTGFAGQLSSEVDRMLRAPQAREPMVGRFTEWLELDGTGFHPRIEELSADPLLYPLDSPELRGSMRVEIEALIARALSDHGGSVEYLLTTRDAYIDLELAELYGVRHPTGVPGEFAWVQLPADQRAGLFTRAGFLAIQANALKASAIRRGVFLARNVFCFPLSDPPPNVSDQPITGGGDPNAALTTRAAVAQVTGDAYCQACHGVINPLGFAFEHYDAIGAWQDVETVEASDGSLHELPVVSTSSVVWPVAGLPIVPVRDAVELSALLAQDPAVRRCVAKKWFGHAFGRAPTDAEMCSLEDDLETYQSSSELTDLITGLASSDAFVLTRVACSGTDCTEPSAPLQVRTATASSSFDRTPVEAIDGDLATWWAAEGDGEFITLELGAPRRVSEVKIAFHKGNERVATFDIELLLENGTTVRVASRLQSSGTTLDHESFAIGSDVAATAVRIVGHGNTVNEFIALAEIEILGL